MSLKTADCKAAIINFLKSSGGSEEQLNEKNWKRESKRGNKKEGFTRVFSNTKDTSLKIIIESDEEEITGIFFEKEAPKDSSKPLGAKQITNKLPAGKYLYCVQKTEEEDYEDFPYLVFINPVNTWEKEGCLADHYTDTESDEIDPVIEELDLEVETESTYTLRTYEKDKNDIISVTELILKLEAAGFVHSPDFSRFIWNSCDIEEEEMLPWWDVRKVRFGMQIPNADNTITKNMAALGCATECSLFLVFKENLDFDRHMSELESPMLADMLEKFELDESSECWFDYLGSKSPEELKKTLEAAGWEYDESLI